MGTGRGVRELSPEVGREGKVLEEGWRLPFSHVAICVLLTAREH